MAHRRFERRFVAFVDVLGFRGIVNRMDADEQLFVTIRDALKELQKQSLAFRDYQQSLRGERRRVKKKGAVPLFNTKSRLEMTAFSDCYVLSEVFPAWHVLAAVQALASRFLQRGILTRGGVAVGDAYHRHDVLFGKAIVEAYELEREVAKYPRIIVSDDVRQTVWGYHEGLCQGRLLQKDVDGCWYVNVLVPPLSNWTALTGARSEHDINAHLELVRASLSGLIDNAGEHPAYLSKVGWLAHKFNEAATVAGIDGLPSP
jgi:hypothetical protein